MPLMGLAIGAINGLAVVKLRMPSFIATMAIRGHPCFCDGEVGPRRG